MYEGGYRVVMIDFGQRQFRQKDESDAKWGLMKCTECEEGAIGLL